MNWGLLLAAEALSYLTGAFVLLVNGYVRELRGKGQRGIHHVIWTFHTGLHITPGRSYGDERRLRRTAGGNNRATPEGSVVFWTPLSRWYRALRNNGIWLVLLMWTAAMLSDPPAAISGMVVLLFAIAAALVALRVAKARAATSPLAPAEAKPVTRARKARQTLAEYQVLGEERPTVPGADIAQDDIVRVEKPRLQSGVPVPVLATLLAGQMGSSPAEIAALLRVRPESGQLQLPDYFPALLKQRDPVEEVIRAHTIGSVRFSWETTTNPRMLVWKPVVSSMPRKALFRDWEQQILALPPRVFAVGLTADKQMYTTSHNGDTPWHCRSAGSGTGKSTGFVVKAAQILRKDPLAELYCIDTKQVSFECLKDIPGVHVYDNPQSEMQKIWEVFYALEAIMRERYTAMREGRAKAEDFNDIWLLVDEGNDLSGQLKSYWSNRVKEKGEPTQPIVWSEAIGPVLRLGRQARIFGEFMLQDVTDRALGGESLKMAFSVFGMAGYKKSQWDRIVGPPCPPCQEGPGRICMVRGNEQEWVQGFCDDLQWLRDWALAGRR